MPASIRIQRLQWIVVAAAALGCALLGGLQVAEKLTELGRTGRAVAGMARFGLILAAADTISAERGPANAAMDTFDDPSGDRIRTLSSVRAVTDRRLAEAGAASDQGEDGGQDPAFDRLARHLAAARETVDAVAALPSWERGGAIAGAIHAMFAVADEAALLRAEAGRRLLEIAPEVGSEVLLQAEASALREEAGRLGSYAVMKLTGALTADEARVWFLRKEDAIRHLRDVLSAFGKTGIEDAAVARALAEVEAMYVAGSLPQARLVFADPGLRGSAADFTGRYVPGLAAPTRLKDALHALTLRRIQRARDAAAAALLLSAGLTAAVMVVLVWLGLTFRRRLFRPLVAMHEEIQALAVGHLADPGRRAPCGSGIDEMFAGLAVLREGLRRKRVLERARRRTTRNLTILAETDSLTGLRNRRAVAAQAPRMIDAAEQAKSPVGAILVDIDHFKMVNDTHGHAGGDAVLRRVAAALASLVGPGDLLARYGGEEFLIVAPGRDEAATQALAERMRRHLAAGDGEGDAGPAVTGSFGVACRPPGSGLDWEALVARADRALYRAKRLGRDRVCVEGRRGSRPPEALARRA